MAPLRAARLLELSARRRALSSVAAIEPAIDVIAKRDVENERHRDPYPRKSSRALEQQQVEQYPKRDEGDAPNRSPAPTWRARVVAKTPFTGAGRLSLSSVVIAIPRATFTIHLSHLNSEIRAFWGVTLLWQMAGRAIALDSYPLSASPCLPLRPWRCGGGKASGRCNS